MAGSAFSAKPERLRPSVGASAARRFAAWRESAVWLLRRPLVRNPPIVTAKSARKVTAKSA